MRNYVIKKFIGGASFALGIVALFGLFMYVRAVAPGAVTNPTFGPLDDDVTLNDAQYVNGNQIDSLTPGRKYAVMIYGYAANLGSGGVTLPSMEVRVCGDGILKDTKTAAVNWSDGNPPTSVTFIITAPSSGCVEGLINGGGEVLNMASWPIL